LALKEQDFRSLGKWSRSRSASLRSRLAGLPFNDSPTFEQLERLILRKLTASRPASHARMSRSRGAEPDSKASALALFMSLRESCKNFDPLGLCSRMFPDYFLPTKEETLRKSSGFSWSSAGMGFHGVCSTADISTWPSDGKECSLSDVLESHVPQRFFLSPRAARGILRRAEKRGRILPSQLQAALESLARADGWKMTSTSSQEPSPEHAGNGTTKIPIRSSPRLSGNQTAITGEAVREETAATISRPPLRKISEASSGQARLLLNSQQEAGSREADIPQSPMPCAKTPEERVKRTTAPTLSTKNEVASSSTQREKWMEQCSEMLMTVRRLTPTECETLQAFPKGWTLPATEHWGTQSRRRSQNGLEGE
jgi:hypothetical protein